MPLPTVVIEYADGSRRTLSPTTIAEVVQGWSLSPDGIVRIDLNPGQLNNRGVDFIFSGGDRFWAYPEGQTTIVLGWRRPALDVGTPNEVPEQFQEAVYDRRPNVAWVYREPTSIPLAATVKRWPHG